MDDLAQGAVNLGASLLSGLVPVLLFLAGLRLLDSFKLVLRGDVLRSILAGAVAAGAAFALNTLAVRELHVDGVALRRYLAPVVEEALKAAFLVALLRTARIGFLVDAAIHGFAIGTGFALVENVFYAVALGHFDPTVWIVRGLGTAIMHGSTTAVVSMLARRALDARARSAAVAVLPGLALAIVAHSLYNHILLNPLLVALIQLLSMPVLLIAVFERSERATRDWLGVGFDGDVERLEQLLEGEVHETPVGRYLESLRARFEGAVLADMLCLIRIHLELALRAKGILIARSAGVDMPPDPAVRANLEEMRYLERTIGATGRLAVQPLLANSDKDLWQLHLLRGE
jgi:RsiW-degrading membrane proteinase PrsW (M82 family)